MQIILASQSKARAALLMAAGYRFRQAPSGIDEPEPVDGTDLDDHVRELARLKAEAVAQRYPAAAVIGADTALILGRQIIGKPASLAEAVRMLGRLGGRTHRISSAACVILPGRGKTGGRRVVELADTAHVRLRAWPAARLRAHVALTRPLNWAGAYAVQDALSAAIVERIDGDPATVIGLPMEKLDRVLRRCR
jgi:septum formation protein